MLRYAQFLYLDPYKSPQEGNVCVGEVEEDSGSIEDDNR